MNMITTTIKLKIINRIFHQYFNKCFIDILMANKNTLLESISSKILFLSVFSLGITNADKMSKNKLNKNKFVLHFSPSKNQIIYIIF